MTAENESIEQKIEIGDTVYVTPYKTQSMDGYWSAGYLSGTTGVVTGLRKDYDWRSTPNLALIRVLSEDGKDARSCERKIDGLKLVAKGPGRFELGVTHPFSEEELKKQRWDAYVVRAHLHDLTHQGYSNPATFLAALYLDQSTAFRAQLPDMWRKDGTVNADKVRKAFGQLGMTIDPWAYECPVEAPEEFQHHINPIRAKLNVNWDEVAAEFTRDKMRESMGIPETRAAA